jgi:hypothetical protein
MPIEDNLNPTLPNPYAGGLPLIACGIEISHVVNIFWYWGVNPAISGPFRLPASLPLSSQTSALDLAQGLGTTEEGNNADNAGSRQGSEQVPAAVVQEEDTLHRNDGTKKGEVGNGSAAQSLSDVRHIGAEQKPLVKWLVTAEH